MPVLVSRSTCSETFLNLSYWRNSFQSWSVTRQRVSASFASDSRRLFCAFFERWNQNFTSSTFSCASICSKLRISSMYCISPALDTSPVTRLTMGQVYQEPKKMPMFPFAGSARQNRHMCGRSRSSSVRGPKARVRMWRGSIHSLSRLTVSPLPAPSTPAISTTTAACFFSRRSYWASSSASRSAGTSLSQVFLSMAWPSSADSNMGRSSLQAGFHSGPAGRPVH